MPGFTIGQMSQVSIIDDSIFRRDRGKMSKARSVQGPGFHGEGEPRHRKTAIRRVMPANLHGYNPDKIQEYQDDHGGCRNTKQEHPNPVPDSR